MIGRLRIAALLAAGLLAAACGVDPATAPDPPDGVVIGGSATIAMQRPASIDPSNVVDRSGEVVARTMCDTLLGVDHRTGELVPGLVESWIVTDGGMRVVLRLRDGLTFPDGREVDARDVVFSLSRAASAAFAGENADLLAGITGYDALRGRAEADEPRHRREFAGLRVLSATAFEMSLDLGAPAVLPSLAHPVASVFDRSAPEGGLPACVGPYRPLTPWDPDAPTFALERVHTYGGVADAFTAGGQGFLERLTFHWFDAADVAAADGGPQVAGPAPGAHDVVEVVGPDAAPAGVEVLDVVGPGAQYVGVPDRLLGVGARRALSLALDRTELARRVGGLAPLTAFLPASLGSSHHRPDACPWMDARADLAQARATLEEAGDRLAGVTLRVATNPELGNLALVEEVVRQWRAAFPGFNPVVSEVPWERYRLGFEDLDGFDTGFRTSNRVPMPSPLRWLAPLRTGAIGVDNPAAFVDPVFDDLVGREATRATDPVDQAVVFRQAEGRLCDAMPLIPVGQQRHRWAVRDGLASATGDLADLADRLSGGLRLRELHRPAG